MLLDSNITIHCVYLSHMYRSPHNKKWERRRNWADKNKHSDYRSRHSNSQEQNSRTHSRKGSPFGKEPDSKRSERSTKDHEKAKGDDSSLEAAKAIQEKIEEDMKKRKERMEAWRQKRQKEEDEQAKRKSEDGEEEGEEGKGEGEEEKKKGWTLEDEDEDDEHNVVPVDEEVKAEVVEVASTQESAGEVEMDEDVDPLDAFMVGVQQEVKLIHTASKKKVGTKFGTGKRDR